MKTVQNLCGSYEVYVFGSPAALVWENPRGHWVFEHTSLFINIFTEEKCHKRQLDKDVCLRFDSNMSLSPFPLKEVSFV